MPDVIDLSKKKALKLLNDFIKPFAFREPKRYFQIGGLLETSNHEYACLIYPYTPEKPVDKAKAYLATIEMLNEHVECNFVLLLKNQIKYLSQGITYKKLTKDEALELLEEACEPKDINGVIYYNKIDKLIEEDGYSHSWLVYPYTSETPLDNSVACLYHVSNLYLSVYKDPKPLSQRLLKYHQTGIMERDLTKEEAFEILQEHFIPLEKDGIRYNHKIGEYCGNQFSGGKETSFSWLVYPYSSVSPVDNNFAFLYHVVNETETVVGETAHVDEERLKALRQKS
jgi:hypothetical protein